MTTHPDLPMLTDAQFADALASCADLVRMQLAPPLEADFTPILIAWLWDDEAATDALAVNVLLGLDMGKRRETLAGLGAEYAHQQSIVRAVFFLTEAWLSRNKSYKLAEQDPARQEIIIIAGLTLDNRSCLGRVHVSRDADNNMVAGESELFAYGPDAEVEVTNRICAHFFIGYQEALRAMLTEGGAA